jgi:predicted Fe-Mo cluster-binding NifX family protein
MKIAIASTDGVSVSQHFGRSKCFIIFEVKDGKIGAPEVRDNTYTAFAKGECHGDSADHESQPHSHSAIVAALKDCDVLLCQGMGWRAAEELKANGIQPLVFDEDLFPAEAAAGYLAGTLRTSGTFCRCHE